jgi:PAS domain S-box-containing protein
MMEFFTRLLDTDGFPARWYCGAWTEAHGWLHVISDLAVWLAYFAIPCILVFFVLRRRDVPFPTIFWLFGAFILACGTTHLIEAIIFWHPVYRLAGVVKLATAAVSWATVFALVPVVPKALALRSPEELDREIAARIAAEEALRQVNAGLEQKVQERTAELAAANAALQEQKARLHATLVSIGDAVIVTDAEGRVTLLNPIAQALTGWQDYAVGQPLDEVFHIVSEHTGERVESPMHQVLRAGAIVGLANHTVLVAKNGARIPIDDSAAPVRGSSGEIVGVVMVFRDVSERRRSEDAALKTQNILKLVHGIARIGHWEWNALTDQNNWSPEIESLYGLPPGGFEGGYDGWAKRLHPDDVAKATGEVQRGLETGKYFTEFRVVWPDGSVRWLEARANAIKDAAGKSIGFVGINMDVTDRKRTEEALRAGKDELEQRVKERTADLSEAVARLQLEIDRRSQAEEALRERSQQLSALAGELVLAEQRERRRLAKIIHDHLQQFLVAARFQLSALASARNPNLPEGAAKIDGLLSGCLDVSRSLTVELSPPVLHEDNLAESLRWLGAWMAEQHGLDVTCNCADVPALAEEVKVFLYESGRELLLNVVKHAKVKSAQLTVTRDSGPFLRLTITDDGPGFDPGSIKPGGAGTGFGLFSMRERAELLGGRLEFESAPRGCRVHLAMPIRAPEAPPVPAPPSTAPEEPHPTPASADSRIRLLIADDHAVLREGLMLLLSGQPDIEVIGQAVDGEDAVQLARQLQPQVVLMDVSMPRMNGIEATRLIRAEMPHIHIIGLSMYAESERGKTMREAGAAQYLRKDCGTNELLSAIRVCVAQ